MTIGPGDIVRYRNINLLPKYSGATVISVKGTMAMVRWRHSPDPVEEWIPNLMIDERSTEERFVAEKFSARLPHMYPAEAPLLTREQLMRKGDQESELGSLAASEKDNEAAARHFKKAKEYWRQAREM